MLMGVDRGSCSSCKPFLTMTYPIEVLTSACTPTP
jgi:hypothetical protein